MRRGEHDDIALVAGRAIGGNERIDFGAADRFGTPASGRHAGETPAVQISVLSRDPGNMEQSGRTVACHRSAEMLQRVGAGRAVDTLDQRHLPIGAALAPDDAAERAPFAEVMRLRIEAETSGRAAVLVEV